MQVAKALLVALTKVLHSFKVLTLINSTSKCELNFIKKPKLALLVIALTARPDVSV